MTEAEQHPRQYLEDVMHNTRLPLTLRMDAASHLLRLYGRPVREQWNGCTIRIAPLPEDIDPTDFCSDVLDCLRRTTPCPWQRRYPHLRECKTKILEQRLEAMMPEGHA